MNRPASRPDELTPAQMVARLAPHIDRAAAERGNAKAALRTQFPFMAEMTDLFRDAGLDPRPVYAKNPQGEEWGKNPDGPVGFKTAAPAQPPGPIYADYEASWRKSLAKKAETMATYRERMQRAIKPGMGIE
jgi:hypothetical protein